MHLDPSAQTRKSELAYSIMPFKRFRSGDNETTQTNVDTNLALQDCSPHLSHDIGLTNVHIPRIARHHPLIIAYGVMFRVDR